MIAFDLRYQFAHYLMGMSTAIGDDCRSYGGHPVDIVIGNLRYRDVEIVSEPCQQ